MHGDAKVSHEINDVPGDIVSCTGPATEPDGTKDGAHSRVAMEVKAKTLKATASHVGADSQQLVPIIKPPVPGAITHEWFVLVFVSQA